MIIYNDNIVFIIIMYFSLASYLRVYRLFSVYIINLYIK